MTDQAHPAPHRGHVSLALLALALFGTPSIWGLRLVLKYGIDSYFCFPGETRHNVLPGWVWPSLLGIDLLTILVAAAAALISFRYWQLTREELAARRATLSEIGEGRTRFLSLWGLMIGVGFVIAVGFDLVGLWIVPVCG